ncbi:hypothetical protein Q669_32160 [Labrenzia sp. C1B10]|nr:hypothetical protein Q669_32160 [Labrenzia sp. C1B10]ERS04195.1 hypothetical protein Q675_30735 [Labrenzia sp. C1B70]
MEFVVGSLCGHQRTNLVFARLGGPYVRVRTAGPLTSPLLLAVNLVVHLKYHLLLVSYLHFVMLLKAELKLPYRDLLR